MITSPYYPIIYVRGYAGTQGAKENTVATPYMGFNLGSTKYRQTYTGEVKPYVFESPLIRLMKDHNYKDAYHDGDIKPEWPVDPRSIWIFRYYDIASKDLGIGKNQEIEFYAKELQKFILHVKEAIGMKNDDNFKVYLVAHSMGGLVCRCYLQNKNIPDLDGKRPGDCKKKGVDKLFTYATPHKGIDFRKGLGWIEGLRDFLDANNSGNFGTKRMSEFLNVDKLNSLNGQFSPERVFCLIGTDPADYGVVEKAVGPQSDGLVQIENAYVKGASRAYVYRSHSGHYGIVNSEGGYRNLERFLFGDTRVSVALGNMQIELPDKGKNLKATYNIENTVAIRGLPIVINKRTVDTYSATFRSHEDLTKKPTHLFTSFLFKKGRVNAKRRSMGFSIHFQILPQYHKNIRFLPDKHYEGQAVFDDRLIIETTLQPDNKYKVKYGWGSRTMKATIPIKFKYKDGVFTANVPFNRARPLKVSGNIIFEVTPWNQ